MNYKSLIKGTAVALVATVAFGTAQAATIIGSLNFNGVTDPLPSGEGLGSATDVSFPSGLLVSNATGDFAASGITFGDSGSISDFSFGGLPVNPLINVGIFSFALETLQIVDQQAMFLVLSGTGTLSGAGFDNTAFAFSMSVDNTGGPSAYSGTLSAVPVPGALLLFMSGLAALGIRRRN